MTKDISIEQRIEENQQLVWYVLHRYFSSLIEDEDIYQCGLIGLWKAAKGYNEQRGKFSTFAIRCIYTSIVEELRKRGAQKKQGLEVSLEDAYPLLPGNDASSHQETGYEVIEMVVALENLKRCFSETDWEIFYLHAIGYTHKSLSVKYKISTASICKIIKRMRTRLRPLLQM